MKNLLVMVLLCSFIFGSCQKKETAANGNGNEVPLTDPPADTTFPITRDKFKWPFSTNSIWNTPIGSEAQYLPSNIGNVSYAGEGPIFVGGDDEYILKTTASDPQLSLFEAKTWSERCGGTNNLNYTLNFPVNTLVADAVSNSTPNNCAAIVQPDGNTVKHIGALTRCDFNGKVFGYAWPDANLTQDGIQGSHGGSGLSAIGGSIRMGELIGIIPIRHALKVIFWSKKYMYWNGSRNNSYRWPATNVDGYANAASYGGSISALKMGALLAIPPDVNIESLNLQTFAAKKIFIALQNYGAYVCDDSNWNAYYFCTEKGVQEELRYNDGITFSGYTGSWHDDVIKLFNLLKVVGNNTVTSIGGGGVPRQPLAPSL